MEYREYYSIKLCITCKFLEIRDIAEDGSFSVAQLHGFPKDWLWVLIKILYIFSLSCKLMMFWTWFFNVLQMYHHLPSNRPYRTATSRTRLWQGCSEGSKLRIAEKLRKIVPRNYIFYFRWAQGAKTRHPKSSLKMYRSDDECQKWTHIGNYCWRHPLKDIVEKVFGK